MSTWIKWGIALSLIWIAFLLFANEDHLGLRVMDWWTYTDIIVLIAIWVVMWALVRPRL